jgi:hypothetical protein
VTPAALLRADAALRRRHPEALPDVVGDALLLDASPFARLVRSRARAAGACFVAARGADVADPLAPLPTRPRHQIPYTPTARAWAALRASTRDAAALVELAPPSTALRDGARWLARATLARHVRSVAAATRLVLEAAFASTAGVLAGMLDPAGPGAELAFRATGWTGDLPSTAAYRLFEREVGRAAAARAFVALFAVRHPARAIGDDHASPLLRALEVPPARWPRSAPLLSIAVARLADVHDHTWATIHMQCARRGLAAAPSLSPARLPSPVASAITDLGAVLTLDDAE